MRSTTRWWLLVGALLISLTSVAFAQYDEDHSHNPYADPTVGPLILPTSGDFVESGIDGSTEKAAGDKGLATFIEMTSRQKTGLLTPFYRFSPSLALKARIPMIFQKSLGFNEDISTSGLGDVSLDGEYTRQAGAGAAWRFQATVKLPTGDDENTVEFENFDYDVPLGTGTMDILARGQYAKSTPDYDWVASVLFRKNDSSEVATLVTPYVGSTYTQTTTTTNGNQFAMSGFARRRANEKWWLHLGVSVVKFFDGSTETTYTNDYEDSENDLAQAGTLIDLYPGISYALSSWSPFLGVRIPVQTSYDDEFASTSRDMAFIFQFSYNPGKMGS